MTQRRAAVVGTGLMGGSIGLALRRRGWHVSGIDHDPAISQRALVLGAIDAEHATGAGTRAVEPERRDAADQIDLGTRLRVG